MIDLLNNLLRQLFKSQITENAFDLVGFQPPDEHWSGRVGNDNQKALNVYLFDLRENRKLRSNARTRVFNDGIVSESLAPRRMDCHYLITAWSPSEDSETVEATLDEQALLYEVTGVLMNNEPLLLRHLYEPGSVPEHLQPLRDLELPTQILPVEGFSKLAEFWGTMGRERPWKPGIYLIVTLPVVLEKHISGPMVTTIISEYRLDGSAQPGEILIYIGGQIWDACHPDEKTSKPVLVPNAWVRLESGSGEPLKTTKTDAQGRFTFDHLQEGTYELRCRAGGHTETSRPIIVPSPHGEYDLSFE